MAARATTTFIAAHDVFQCDLLDMAAVRQLESDAQYGKLHRLLTIFLTGAPQRRRVTSRDGH
jgi:translation initiation factor 3 subunit M